MIFQSLLFRYIRGAVGFGSDKFFVEYISCFNGVKYTLSYPRAVFLRVFGNFRFNDRLVCIHQMMTLGGRLHCCNQCLGQLSSSCQNEVERAFQLIFPKTTFDF